MPDESRITFPGSPDGARSVEITWIAQDAGRFGRDKRVSRAEATHARIHEWGGSNEGERVVTVFEADAYTRRLQAYQEQKAETEADRKRRVEAWLDSLCSTCPHCQQPRKYMGLEQLQEGGRTAAVLLGGDWTMTNVDVHVYQCAYCGSLEFFRDGGPVEHPIRGNSKPPA